MKDLDDVPRDNQEWKWDNPTESEIEFVKKLREVALQQPPRLFNENPLFENVTHWPGARLKKF